MKSSIQKISVLLISILLALVVFVLLFILATSAKAKSLRIDDSITNVFLGDSHIRYAIDDSMLSNSINLGNSSESVYFTYYKLKQLLNSNSSVETVYVGFSYHNISSYYDEYIYGQYSQSVAPNYFYVLPLTEQLQMIKWNFKALPSFMAATLKTGIRIWRNENTFEGGFDNRFYDTAANRATMDKRLEHQFFTNDTLNSFSSLNIRYFDNIAELSQEYEVELIIVNTPLHAYYQSQLPQKFIDKYHALIKSHNLRTIDMSHLELSDSSYQKEGDLVSEEGAKSVTKEVQTSMDYNTTPLP